MNTVGGCSNAARKTRDGDIARPFGCNQTATVGEGRNGEFAFGEPSVRIQIPPSADLR